MGHFDPKVYKNEYNGFMQEVGIFTEIFDDVSSMSFHRPSSEVLKRR